LSEYWLVICFKIVDSSEQTDSVKAAQDTAAAAAVDEDADASSLRHSDHRTRHQSAYGAWQTVQQDV